MGEIVAKALENGLVVISAGSDVLRFVPPLIITKEQMMKWWKTGKNY